ncbi:MAG: LacI family DNA-binding transcriptional regulator [Planctomycetes bacterium]|nr:LacI family DNA-binding transcriptional regulator [Planctomycetota bacterium]
MAKRTSKQERPLPKGCSLTAVAKRAGVSITTVSFVLNGKSASIKIAEATRRKVIEVARELNYRPRVPRLYDAQIAPLFRHIGLAFVNALGQEVHEFFGPAVYEILNRAGKEGVLIHSCDGLAPKEVAGYCTGLRERDCDGLILFTFSTEREAWVDDVRASGMPFVFFNRDFGPDIPCVLMDHAGGAASQAALLAQLGHRRIGLLETVLPGPAYERLAGARAGLRKAGVYDAALEFAAPYDLEAASNQAWEFLSAHPEVTAVLGTTDIVSMGVLRAAARLGRRVPADLSVASLDGYEPGRYADPPLCTIEYPRVRMGQEALELLRERVLNGAVSPARRIVSGERLPGRSVAPPRK